MTELKVGDTVRIKAARLRYPFDAGRNYTVRAVSPRGTQVKLEGIGPGYSVLNFELVKKADTTEPTPAETGVFIAVKLDKSGEPMLDARNPRFDTQEAAEKEAARAATFLPSETFGVLKLIGKVSMQPTWSD